MNTGRDREISSAEMGCAPSVPDNQSLVGDTSGAVVQFQAGSDHCSAEQADNAMLGAGDGKNKELLVINGKVSPTTKSATIYMQKIL